MEPFKNIYNPHSIKNFSLLLSNVDKSFCKKEFDHLVLRDLEALEMKDRVRLICKALNECSGLKYGDQVSAFLKIIKSPTNPQGLSGFMVWPLTHFVQEYGLDDFQHSLQALKEMTKCFTAEFAVRPYLAKDKDRVFKLFLKWRKDSNEHVRRLVSEGTRAHLPWGEKVPSLIEEAHRGIDLIAPLVFDDSEYVRKSVANHLNDITHFNPKLVLDFIESIDTKKKNQQRLVKHASRTLLKKGDARAYKVNGYNPKAKFTCEGFKIAPKRIQQGQFFNLSFKLKNKSSLTQKIQILYKIWFPKKNGTLSPKVFHLKELALKAGEVASISKKHPFKKVTTRTHYLGKHQLELLINGQTVAQDSFSLTGRTKPTSR